MGFFSSVVHLVIDVTRLSGVTHCLLVTIGLMVLVVAYQTFTPYNRD